MQYIAYAQPDTLGRGRIAGTRRGAGERYARLGLYRLYIISFTGYFPLPDVNVGSSSSGTHSIISPG